MSGIQQADSFQLNQPDGDQPRHAHHAPATGLPDAWARIDQLENMVRKLETALVTLMMHATHGSLHKELTAHEIQLACHRLGLRSDIADAMLARTRASANQAAPVPPEPPIPARMCPAFASQSECRGNACGLTCEAALL